MDQGFSRRGVIKSAAVLGAMGLTGALGACASTGERASGAGANGRRRTARFVHFTDPHIRDEHNAVQGVAAAYAHLRKVAPDCELIIGGGDMVFDVFSKTRQQAKEQWDLWNSVTRDGTKLPIVYCCGNHDIWGWDKKGSKADGSEPGWGKRWWLDEVAKRERAYTSMDLGGWRVIVLDSVAPFGTTFGYEGRLDEEQYAWLEQELARTPASTPVLFVTHIPIFSVGMIDCDAQLNRTDKGGIDIGAGAMMMDAHRLLTLMRRHPNVKAVFAGHIHVLERIEYRGVAHICSGAVSGGWWRTYEANQQRSRNRARPGELTPELRSPRAANGFMVVDLFSDGTFENRYEAVPWVNVS
jgi:3',5'-cyclic AMP phosphodiesterase CpdA